MTKLPAKSREPKAPAMPVEPQIKPTKLAVIIGLLRRPEGAQLADLMTATGWQAHSVRGTLSGHVRRKLNLDLVSEKTDAGRIYRIADRVAA
jgi:hypothetical protein